MTRLRVRVEDAPGRVGRGGSAYPDRRDTVIVRMAVDLRGELGEELSRLAAERGVTREALVAEGLGYVNKALLARRDGPFVGRD